MALEKMATKEDLALETQDEAVGLAMDFDARPEEEREAIEKEVSEILATTTPEERAAIRARHKSLPKRQTWAEDDFPY